MFTEYVYDIATKKFLAKVIPCFDQHKTKYGIAIQKKYSPENELLETYSTLSGRSSFNDLPEIYKSYITSSFKTDSDINLMFVLLSLKEECISDIYIGVTDKTRSRISLPVLEKIQKSDIFTDCSIKYNGIKEDIYYGRAQLISEDVEHKLRLISEVKSKLSYQLSRNLDDIIMQFNIDDMLSMYHKISEEKSVFYAAFKNN